MDRIDLNTFLNIESKFYKAYLQRQDVGKLPDLTEIELYSDVLYIDCFYVILILKSRISKDKIDYNDEKGCYNTTLQLSPDFYIRGEELKEEFE